MRPTTSTMLQQNNNNNYPCLNVSGSTREMLQKCSRSSLPFPSRLELGLGDLPLIRGLRAWALCSKNRRKAGSLLGGGQAPTAPPAGHGSSTSCPRPADVHLSGEWGRMGYGLPLGLDARQAGIGALVTVATLKTSEGSGKTQTQCLFLRTEKGSCLYSTAKPSSGVTASAASSVVGGWLRGKTGGGGRDTPAGRRDSGPTLPAQTGANRVRVRSGRRWRKSGNAAGREKTGVSRERQQRSREVPAADITVEERQEARDKGGLDCKQLPSPQQDSRRVRCCHNVSPKACTQCGRRAQRRESQDEQDGGGSPRRGVPNRLNSEVKGKRKERQKNEEEEEEEEEEKGILCKLESSNSDSSVPNLESNGTHRDSHGSCDVGEMTEAESNEELKTQTSQSRDDSSEKDEDTHPDVMKLHTGSKDFIHGPSGLLTDDFKSRLDPVNDTKPGDDPCEEIANADGFSGHAEANQESEKDMECVDVKEEEGSIIQGPDECMVASSCSEDSSVLAPASMCTAVSLAESNESSVPVEGSVCSADHETCWVQTENRNSQNHLEEYHQGEEAEPGVMGKEELDGSRSVPLELNVVAGENITVNEDSDRNRKPQFFLKNEENNSQLGEKDVSPSPLGRRDLSISETDKRIVTESSSNCRTIESEQRDELEAEQENIEERLNPEPGDEAGEIWRECTCNKLDDGKGDDMLEDNYKGLKRSWTPEDDCRLQESAGGCSGWKEEDGDAAEQTSITYVEPNAGAGTYVTYVACADPPTSLAFSLANPAPSLPPLGSMATGLPCLEAEKEEEVVVVRARAGDGGGGQEGKRRQEGDLEERDSTVATEEGRKEEEEEEEDEFGVFMQAEGEPAWSEGFTMSASVPCGSRESAALGNHAITSESTQWTPGWTDGSFHQSDDTWAAFPQDSSDEVRDIVEQWWPTSAVEERRDRLSTNQNLAAVFAEAFPSLPGSSSSDPCNLNTVPTLTQLLRGRAGQDQGLLDSFHDLNKMIGQRYKRANGVSRDLLLKTLHLEQPHTESRPAPWTANRRLSPGLPSANQHAQNAATKRRLSYDYNRNIME